MAGLRSVAWLVALLLVASLLVNFRYVKYTSAVQDPCPRPAEPARAATPASAEVQPASKLPGVQAPMHRRRAPLPATTPQASTAEPAHSGAAGAVEDPSFIIVTFATKGVLDFALNWVLHIRALELPHMLGAMDDTMVTVCERWGVPVHAVHRGGAEASSSDALSGLQNAGMLNVRGSDKGFAGLGVLKTLFIQSLLRGGRDVLISDTDTAWFRDPRPLVYGREPPYHDFSKADLLISTDCIDSTDDESDGNSGCWYTPVQKNTGMMFFRANNRSLTFVKEWEVRARRRLAPRAGPRGRGAERRTARSLDGGAISRVPPRSRARALRAAGPARAVLPLPGGGARQARALRGLQRPEPAQRDDRRPAARLGRVARRRAQRRV